jgi:hypothetical protein
MATRDIEVTESGTLPVDILFITNEARDQAVRTLNLQGKYVLFSCILSLKIQIDDIPKIRALEGYLNITIF